MKHNQHEKDQFVILFKKFMQVNNKLIFSATELKDVTLQLCTILGRNKTYSLKTVMDLLEKDGVVNIHQKHLSSQRSKLWFYKPLNPQTLKICVNA